MVMEGRFNIVPFTEFALPSVPVYLFYKDSVQVPQELLQLFMTRDYL
jgi:LysR family transcriptional repressor of citA